MPVSSLNPPATPNPYRRRLHVLALLTACAVFPLIFVGQGVTSKEAGMAFPDWPTSNGHLLNPPGWLGQEDTLWEHGHRLIGWTVGMLAIATAVSGWSSGGAIRKLSAFTLLAIIVQGLLGGFRVIEISTAFAMIHGILGQLCFCLAATTALITSRGWIEHREPHPIRAAIFLRKLCTAGTAAVMVQLLLGAGQRHFACTYSLVFHILWAIVVAFVLGWIALWLMGHDGGRSTLARLGRIIAALTAVQLLLGGLTFVVTTMMGTATSPLMEWLIPTVHSAVGALILAFMVLTTACTHRMVSPELELDGMEAASPTA